MKKKKRLGKEGSMSIPVSISSLSYLPTKRLKKEFMQKHDVSPIPVIKPAQGGSVNTDMLCIRRRFITVEIVHKIFHICACHFMRISLVPPVGKRRRPMGLSGLRTDWKAMSLRTWSLWTKRKNKESGAGITAPGI